MILLDGIADEVQDISVDFPFPDVSNPLYFSSKTVVSGNKVIGAGIVRHTAEAILILDTTQPLITRGRAALALVDALKIAVPRAGLDECHAFVRDSNVEKFLTRVGFVACRGGKPLVIHF